MRYRIAICDDELKEIHSLTGMVSIWSKQTGCIADVHSFLSAEEFLFEYDGNNLFDILLLDVEMHTISGIELAKRIRLTDRRAEIIFITSHSEFIGEGYEVDALHYLIKPVTEIKLSEVLSRAIERLSVEPVSVVINYDGETVKLTEDKILYIEAFSHYISIHTTDSEYKIKESISAFESKLSDNFFRVQRSYIVSLKAIERISRNSVVIEGGTELPLSRGLYDAVNRAFIEHN